MPGKLASFFPAWVRKFKFSTLTSIVSAGLLIYTLDIVKLGGFLNGNIN